MFRIRKELIFRRCWNLVTPSRSFRGSPSNIGRAAYLTAGGPKIFSLRVPVAIHNAAGNRRTMPAFPP